MRLHHRSLHSYQYTVILFSFSFLIRKPRTFLLYCTMLVHIVLLHPAKELSRASHPPLSPPSLG